MNPRHYDSNARDFILRFGRTEEHEYLEVLEKETQETRASYSLQVEDLRRILRGGSFQFNGMEGYLLIRSTSEGIWILFERKEHDLSGSCLMPRQELLGIVALLSDPSDLP
jgi:hypothetical protein